MEQHRKDRVFTSEIKPLPDKDRVLRFITSTEAQDRDGDIIEAAGWQLENYMKNPVVLFGHDYTALPVGKTLNIEIDPYSKRLIQDIQFPTADEYEFADTVYRMIKSGYLNTTSVGFMGIEYEPMFDESKNYLGRRYIKQELLETSIVPVPSNPQALIEARSKGILKEADMKLFESQEKVGACISARNKEILKGIHQDMHNAHQMIKGCGRRLKELLLESEPEDLMDMGDFSEEEEPMGSCKNPPSDTSKKSMDEEETSKTPEDGESNEKAPDTDTSADTEIDLDLLVDEDDIDCTSEELEKALSNLLETKLNKIRGGK